MEKSIQEEFEKTRAQMRKGILEFCTLLIISKKEIYSSEILEELKEADLVVVEGTLYPLLSRMRKSNLLDYKWQESKAGPPRKYYMVTERGTALLKELTKNWKSLSKTTNSLIRKFK